MLKYIKVN